MQIKKWGFAVGIFSLSGIAQAADIQFRGFASFVAGSTLQSDEELYGYDEHLDFRNDSLIALQVDTALDEKLSATMQFMSRGANDYEPVMEWAYLTYEFSDKLQLSGGRIRIPFYRYSDFIDVRYAYNWLKVPQTVYGFEFPGYDGASLVYTNQFAGWDSSLQLIFGQFEGETAELDAVLEDLAGFSWTLNRGWLTLRAGYVNSKATIAIPQIEGLAQLIRGMGMAVGADVSDLADDLVLEGDRGDFWGLALGVDYNNVLLDAEYIQYALNDGLLAETDAFYVAAGYRFGKWIPLLTYSELSSDPPEELLARLPANVAAVPVPGANPPITVGEVFELAVSGTAAETELLDVGLRYDFHHSAAFKMAWTQTEDIAGNKNQLLRFAIDLVF